VFAAAKTVEEGGTIKRLFVRAKSNLSVDGGGYEYALEAGPVPGHPEVTVPAVTWGSALQGTARELLATAEAAEPVEDRSATDEAVDWLSEVLSAGRVKAGEVQKEARQAGITDKALRRARERLGVKPAKHEFLGGWWWSLPSQDAQDAQDAHDCDTKKRGIFEGEGHLRAGNDAGAVIV
jgi:hypothetical protein